MTFGEGAFARGLRLKHGHKDELKFRITGTLKTRRGGPRDRRHRGMTRGAGRGQMNIFKPRRKAWRRLLCSYSAFLQIETVPERGSSDYSGSKQT